MLQSSIGFTEQVEIVIGRTGLEHNLLLDIVGSARFGREDEQAPALGFGAEVMQAGFQSQEEAGSTEVDSLPLAVRRNFALE